MGWLRQHALPLTHGTAGNGFADLEPLKRILQDVTIVGLGEATHGTREFIQIKHRLFEFLVTEMGFCLLMLEASYAACQPINAYVLTGAGDLAELLADQWYTPWDTEEFTELVVWMRAYNQRVPIEQRVRFSGVDITRNERGRKAVLALLHTVDPDRVAATMTLFAAQAAEEAKWPLRIDDAAQQAIITLLPELHALGEHLRAHAAQFAQLVSPETVDQAIQYTRVIEQWLLDNAGDRLPPAVRDISTRSVFMAENVLWLMDREAPGTKAVVWQADAHVCLENPWDGLPNLGSVLHKRYAERYFALGLEFGQGSFITRTVLPDNRLGDLHVITLPPAPVGTLPWLLSQLGHAALMLQLRLPVENLIVERWLHTPQLVYNCGWVPQDDETFQSTWDLTRMYDAIIFVGSTTPIRPTISALRRIALRDGL